MTPSFRHGAGLASVLMAVWLLWSGHYTSLLVTFGALSSAGVVLLCIRMRIVDHESAPLSLPLRALGYLPWLAFQVIRANLDVARRILSPSLPIRPSVIRVRASQRDDLGRVIYANSITLTPGTVSIDMTGDTITVHALTAEAAEDLRGGEMDRRVRAWQGGD